MNTETAPIVSVLVPMKNAESYVVAALASVLLERDVPIEVVVINDKSSDRSLGLVSSICDNRIRVIDGPGAGIAACLNAGIAAAKGDIIMRCDADDLYPAARIKEQVAWLDANPEYAAVCSGFSTIDTAGRLVASLVGDTIEDVTCELNSGKTRTTLCTYAIRRRSLHAVGGFRQYFVTSSDIDFQLRLGEVGKVMYLPYSSYLYRLHDESITHTQGSNKRVFFEETARKFQAQRKTTGQDDLQRGRPPTPPEVHSDKPGAAAQQIQGMLMGTAWRQHAAGNRFKAIGAGWRALLHSPSKLGVWRSFLVLLVKSVKYPR